MCHSVAQIILCQTKRDTQAGGWQCNLLNRIHKCRVRDDDAVSSAVHFMKNKNAIFKELHLPLGGTKND